MIYDYQRPIYEKLKTTAKAHELSLGLKLPCKPRFHKLVVGPTGSGKSYLAELVSKELGWRFKFISTSSWVVIGAREEPTWRGLEEWFSAAKDEDISILVLDEMDKIHDDSSWSRSLRSEIFSLLDGRCPLSFTDSFDTDGEITKTGDDQKKKVHDSLARTIVIGCGAFQEAFDSKPSVGFDGKHSDPKSLNDLSKYIQRELINRFDSDVLVFPTLKEGDYSKMVDDLEEHLPEAIFQNVKRKSLEKIKQAVVDRSAARFAENLLSEALVEFVFDNTDPWS